jgi:hypothetical protein
MVLLGLAGCAYHEDGAAYGYGYGPEVFGGTVAVGGAYDGGYDLGGGYQAGGGYAIAPSRPMIIGGGYGGWRGPPPAAWLAPRPAPPPFAHRPPFAPGPGGLVAALAPRPAAPERPRFGGGWQGPPPRADGGPGFGLRPGGYRPRPAAPPPPGPGGGPHRRWGAW